MNRRLKLILAAGLGLAVIAGGATVASAMLLQDASAELRSSGQAGEQADGYLGLVGSASADLRAKVDAVNIKRRAYYTDLAAKRGAKIEEVAATTACELLRNKVGAGQFYRLPDGVWRKREGAIALPSYCG
ncbi:MAG: DUF1318 domain-containing protein [Alphaproteobacteria bacterium]|nr:MAG: DUF1318 domain-containing protein [Alphaproteobacteria bacterium]